LGKVYPDSLVDDYVFDPCGYSANGLLGSYYYTIHVTPEEHCSYASFETTIPVKSFRQVSNHDIKEYDTFGQVVEKIISIFKPGKFSTTLFVRRSMKSELQQTLKESTPKGFRHRDRIVHSLGRWELVFSHYERKLKNCYINIDH
jgi:S-adenosylmethionine decarboxylase